MGNENSSKLRTRAITGIIFVFVVLALLTYNKITASILLVVITLFCSYEYTNISRKGLKDPLFNLTFFCGAGPLIGSYIKPEYIEGWECIILTCSTGLMAIFALSTLLFKIRTNHHIIGPIISLIYIGLPMAMVSRLVILGEPGYQMFLFLGILISMWVSDTGAYIVGRLIGRTPLNKRISPNKTIEGWLGAGIFAGLAGYIMSLYFDQLDMISWIIVMVAGWFFGSMGDLYESSIKRQFDIKDSGNVLPGHGGFLDRFDSFLFAAPAITLLVFLVFKY